ncbi:hypothetical protein Taro_003302 [Colocasia esculenta]|uniref:Uncharacterized protein n=1 Tax=Colocasia esculenta TaxID=4460 RepID=A0A843TNN5_COLES|nr:hypothetical protein [Colocasia esculenta]
MGSPSTTFSWSASLGSIYSLYMWGEEEEDGQRAHRGCCRRHKQSDAWTVTAYGPGWCSRKRPVTTGDLEMGGVLGSVSVRVARELLQSGHQYLDVSTRYLLGNGRLLSTLSSNMDGPFKVQEVETVDVPPPPTEKGGNGFVGSHVCKEALDKGLSVSSMSRYVLVDSTNYEIIFDT